MLAPDAHLSKSAPKRCERCQCCWTVQLDLFPVVSLGAAVTNEVAVGMSLLLRCAHKIMYMYRGPGGVAAPPAPTDARLKSGGSSRQILKCWVNLLHAWDYFVQLTPTSYLKTAPLCSKVFIKIQGSCNYEEDNYYTVCIWDHSSMWHPDHLCHFTYLYISWMQAYTAQSTLIAFWFKCYSQHCFPFHHPEKIEVAAINRNAVWVHIWPSW